MSGVDSAIILEGGQSDVKISLVQLVSAHGPKVVLVHEFRHFGFQNLSHNANYDGGVVLIALASLGL
jgi:hypothetical protein